MVRYVRIGLRSGRDRSCPYMLTYQAVHEIVLRPHRVAAGVQKHRAPRLYIDAGPAGDGQRGIRAIVVVRSLYGDIAAAQKYRPEALPFGLAGCHGASALPVVV